MVEVRALRPADAEACDAIVASLPYHFGQEDGRAECARKVRSQPGLVARDLPGLWPNDTAVLLVRSLP